MTGFFRLSFNANVRLETANDKYPRRFTDGEMDDLSRLLEKHKRLGKLTSYAVQPSRTATTISVFNRDLPWNNCVMAICKKFDQVNKHYQYDMSSRMLCDTYKTLNFSKLIQVIDLTLDDVKQTIQPTLKIMPPV